MASGNVAADWKRFRSQWANYEVATDLAEESKAKRAAVFLACLGTEAFEVCQAMPFDTEADRQDIDKLIEAFERHCVGEINISYERYVLNRRAQDLGETFDSFLSDIRRLIRSCEYGDLEESIIRDRIVIGIRDDSTRRKLLQIRKLTLASAIDVCRATEVATKQLKAMAPPLDDVHALSRSPSRNKAHRSRYAPEYDRKMERHSSQRCEYCGRSHEPTKEACPAYGQICRACSRRHHFQHMCKSKPAKSRVYELHDEVLLSLSSNTSRRLYSTLNVDGHSVRFLLDCGSTVNLLPKSLVVASVGDRSRILPPTAKLRMFDNTELQTAGMMTATVQHPVTQHTVTMNFYITTTHQQPILGLDACLEFELLAVREENICALQPPSPLTMDDILAEYGDLFEGLGEMPGEVHLDVDETVPPVQMPLRRLPIPIKDKVEQELNKMCTDGIIERVNGPSKWLSALLVVSKPSGKIRICIDPKPLNRALQRRRYRMPTIDDVLPLLTKAKVFSLLDAKNGFWQLKLDEASSDLTHFGTAFGRFKWLRLCFGISPAPEIFQARIHEALEGLNGVACIADDILVFGSGDDLIDAQNDHDRNLIALLQRCREQGIKINREKVQLNRPTTTFMGHELSASGLRADPRKIEAIRQMPPPTDRAAVMRLLGVCTYLSRFVPNFSEATAKIRELLPATAEFHWDSALHGAAFEKLKDLLSSAPVLQYYDVHKPIVVQADASQSGLGAVLLQDGRPVEYASRAMSRIERDSYAQVEKETLASVFAVERFRSYLFGKHFVLQTDHKPLLSIVKKALSDAPKRLQRLLLRLQSFDFELEFVPGKDLLIADALSRAYISNTDEGELAWSEEVALLTDDEQLRLCASEDTVNMIKAAAAADDQYQMLIRQIKTGWPAAVSDVPNLLREYYTFSDELTVSDGLAFKGQRVVIPHGARSYIIQRLHSSHIGMNGTIRRAREAVFYPNITRDIKAAVSSCETCSTYQAAIQKEPLLPHPPPARVWQEVACDIFAFKEHNYLLTCDYLSNYFEVDRLPNKSISSIIYCLKGHFARHGLPEKVYTDNNPFNAAEFAAFSKQYDFKHETSSPRYAQSNGKIENCVRTVKNLMRKAVASGNDPFLALLEWRNTPSESLGLSPVQIIFGRHTRTKLPTSQRLLATPTATEVQRSLGQEKLKQEKYYNRGARERVPLKRGQTVRVKWSEQPEWRKGRIETVLPNRSYAIQFGDGTIRRRTSKHVRFSAEPPLTHPSVDPPLIETSDHEPTPSEEHNTEGFRHEQPTANDPTIHQMQSPPTSEQPMLVTRCGRPVRPPLRYRDGSD